MQSNVGRASWEVRQGVADKEAMQLTTVDGSSLTVGGKRRCCSGSRCHEEHGRDLQAALQNELLSA